MSEVYEWAGPCANCSRAGKIRWSEDRVYDNYCFDCYSLVNDGRLLERERIIKLIELIQSTAMEEDGILESVISAVKGERVATYGYEWINDFIKGENK